MVSLAISKLGCSKLVFVEPGTKVDGSYYREELLSKELLPAIHSIIGDLYVFQQDNAPAHRARQTVELLRHETPDFIGPDMWPPNSPDLNPVDNCVWGLMQEGVYRTPIRDLSELRRRLVVKQLTSGDSLCSCSRRTLRTAALMLLMILFIALIKTFKTVHFLRELVTAASR